MSSSSRSALNATSSLASRRPVLLRAAEERQHRRRDAHADSEAHAHAGPDARPGFYKAAQDRVFGWLAQRIAEQRLLWHLRRQTSAVAAHPQDMTFDQVLALIR